MARHHFLPRFFLEGFTLSPTSPLISFYQKDLGDWRTSTPINLAVRKDFYIYTDRMGKRRTEVEEFFSSVEGEAASVLNRRVFRRRLVTRSHRYTLATFLLTMLQRVPVEAETLQGFAEASAHANLKGHIEILKRNPDFRRERAERYQRETGREMPDISTFNVDNYRVEYPLGAAVGNSLAVIPEVTFIVAAMGWAFWVARGDEFFITSDYPVGLVDPIATFARVGLHPGQFPNVEVTLALSRSIALAAGWGRPDTTRFLDAPREVVEEINLRTAMRATAIYSPGEQFAGVAALLEGKGCWASSPHPRPGVISQPTEGGQIVGVTFPTAWMLEGRKPVKGHGIATDPGRAGGNRLSAECSASSRTHIGEGDHGRNVQSRGCCSTEVWWSGDDRGGGAVGGSA